MWRSEMAAHEGMLFVFDEPGVQCFWMKNTPLPLSAAFVGDAAPQAKFASAKPQFTSLSRKVSTNFGRRLR